MAKRFGSFLGSDIVSQHLTGGRHCLSKRHLDYCFLADFYDEGILCLYYFITILSTVDSNTVLFDLYETYFYNIFIIIIIIVDP